MCDESIKLYPHSQTQMVATHTNVCDESLVIIIMDIADKIEEAIDNGELDKERSKEQER